MKLPRRIEDDLARDIAEHIEMETRDNIERGMSPEEARFAAMRKFGNVMKVTEDTHAVWHWMWADRLRQDIRYSLRGLRRNPLFAAVAILALALGIGMNTAVFSVVSSVLIKPLPYPHSERIVWIANRNQRFNFEASSAPDFLDWRRQANSFDQMAGYGTVDSTLQDGDQSDKRSFVYITPEFWAISGAHATLGRLFNAADRNVVVLTSKLFGERFNSDPRAIGRVIRVDGRETTIIGVLPAGFRFLAPNDMSGGMSGEAEAFTPNVIAPEQQARGFSLLIMFVVARLKPDVTIDQARAEMHMIQDRIAKETQAMRRFYASAELRVLPLQEKLVGGSRRALLILLAAVAFVLLIACANLANLLLARASAREREIAIRASIGAGRGRLASHFLVEGLTLALAGGAAGLAIAAAADALLVRAYATAVPRLGELGIDWRVLLFTFGISVLSGAVFGLAPVFSVPNHGLYSVLKDGGRGSSGGRAGLHLRRLLVAAELALALVLLTGAGLMVKSFARMYAHPASFQPERIGTMKIFLSGPAYRKREAAFDYSQRLLDRVRRIGGVQAVAVAVGQANGVLELDGPPRFAPDQAPHVSFKAASSGYPQVTGIPLLKGRWTVDDEPTSVILVNEALARRVYGASDPLGQRIRVFGEPATIVGVVGDLKMSQLDADPGPEVLIPYRRTTVFRRLDVLVKTAGDPAALLPEIRKAVQQLEPAQPPYAVMTLEAALSDSIAPRRFQLLLLGTFAASALLLALIGIYGVMSYAVTQRTQEIGVRLALGARRGEIAGMLVRQSMIVAAIGIVSGLAAALGLTRLMTNLLFAVRPDDPATFVTVAAILAATALLASWIPARRATRIDPMHALRYE